MLYTGTETQVQANDQVTIKLKGSDAIYRGVAANQASGIIVKYEGLARPDDIAEINFSQEGVKVPQ